MTLYKKQFKTSSSEANLAGLNSNHGNAENPFLTEDSPVVADSISGLIEGGENITITGSGDISDPYVVNAESPAAVQRTGTAISFDKDAYYNTSGTPGTGDITAVLTEAVLGVTGCILHNSGAEPTFGVEFVKLSSSGDYVTDELNYIYYNYISDTKIVYSISQEA